MRTDITGVVLGAGAHDLRGRVALVTGASGRVGAPLSDALAAAGADLALCARRRPRLEAAARRARARGVRVYAAVCDVASEPQVRRFVREACRRLGCVDILVNGAALRGPRARLADCPPAAWSRVIATNLGGCYHASRAVLRAGMLRRRRGTILNLSSHAWRQPHPRSAPYTASKCGLEGLTLALARELPAGIRVNALDPCSIERALPPEAAAAFLYLLSGASAGRSGQLFGLEETALDARYRGPHRFRVFQYGPGPGSDNP